MKKFIIIMLALFVFSTSLFGCSKPKHTCEFKMSVVEESTCTEIGLAEFKCKYCEELFLVELETKEHNFVASNDGQKQVCTGCGKTENVSHPHQHPIIAVKATAATCGKNGMKAHYFCEYCLKYFTDAEGKEEVKKSSILIPATGKHLPGIDELYQLDGKWFHNQKCTKCAIAVNVDPILCAVCGGQDLTRVNGNNFKCNDQTCAGKDGFVV